ncbi:DUF2937 family protein [Ensifer soli]|uniref:DUF2937 family protein n=1 Tax=Ciceribacter sp. sgz301302 TaxID=3342379 RepID=UPI0035B6E76F
MGQIWKATALTISVAGAVLFSQAPEFAQQYRQRIGGALDELRAIVTDFEARAQAGGLDRERALDLYASSTEGFIQDQGQAMRATFTRYEVLSRQREALDGAPPLLRPAILIAHPDAALMARAWEDFAPAVPVTLAGLAWAGAGGLAAGLLAGAGRVAFRRRRRPVAPRVEPGIDATLPAPVNPPTPP